MDISLSIILDRLSEYRIETYLLQPSEYIFDRIELFPQRIADLKAGRLYLARLSQVISLPVKCRREAVFLCLRDRISDDSETDENLTGTVIVNENISYEFLFTFVQDIFFEIGSWYVEAQQAIIQNRSMQDLIDMSEGILKNYVQVTDSSFKLLGYTRHIECDEEITVLARKHGYHPEKTVEIFRKNHRMEAWSNTTGLLVNDDHAFTKYTTISKVFKFSNTYFAHAVMTCNNHPCTEGTLELFRLFTDILSVYIEREWEDTNKWHHIYDPFLTDIYDGSLTRRDVAEERARHVGIPLYGKFSMALTSPVESGKFAVGRIAQEISAARPNDKVTLWRGRIAILSSYLPGRFVDQFRQAQADLEAVMERFDLRCGVSAVFDDLLGAEQAIRQARQALSCSGRSLGADLIPYMEGGFNSLQQRVVSFEDSFSYILLGNDPNNRALWQSSVYYKALKMIFEYDRQHNLNNLQLLYVYLICESRPTDTAGLMHMSRNNVVYRIGRIEDMLRMDLHSASVRFKLLISYTLMQLYGLD